MFIRVDSGAVCERKGKGDLAKSLWELLGDYAGRGLRLFSEATRARSQRGCRNSAGRLSPLVFSAGRCTEPSCRPSLDPRDANKTIALMGTRRNVARSFALMRSRFRG